MRILYCRRRIWPLQRSVVGLVGAQRRCAPTEPTEPTEPITSSTTPPAAPFTAPPAVCRRPAQCVRGRFDRTACCAPRRRWPFAIGITVPC